MLVNTVASYRKKQRLAEMPAIYCYTARSAEGRFVAGSMQAESAEHALLHLRTRSLFVTSLAQKGGAKATAAAVFTLLPISAGARLAFFRSLATLVRAGVPLRRALEVSIEQCTDGRFAEALRSVANDIESGTALSAAMSRRPREFTRLFIAMIRAGELGGVLDEVLERLASMLELDRAMRKRLSAALAYPAVVACAAVVLVLLLVANIVPAFAGLFAEMHVQLPLSTKILIAIGVTLTSPIKDLALVFALASVLLVVRAAWLQPRLAPTFDRMLLRLPVAGTIVRKTMIARISRTLGTLLRSGVPILDALDACKDIVGNVLYAHAVETVALELREGHAMTVPLERSGLFDPIVLQLIRVGEETGTLDAMLLRVAEYFEIDVESAVAALGSIVEPVLILLLGTVVGTIVASVIIPLYSIIGSIK